MQCLSSVAPLVKYITEGAYCKDIRHRSKHGGTCTMEVGAALDIGKCNPVSLSELKTAVGKLHYPFKGFRQHNSMYSSCRYLIGFMKMLIMEDLSVSYR